MRTTVSSMLEKARVTMGPMASDPSYGLCGAFILRHNHTELGVIASASEGWEYVSVSCSNRTPNWEEMCWVKGLFWNAEETVIQYHPPKSLYVNFHPYCLHMWRPLEFDIPTPPTWMIGPKAEWEGP